MNNTKEWRSFVSWIRKKYPVNSHVRIIRSPCIKFSGSTRLNGCNFVVRINNKNVFSDQKHTLIHEWAHVIEIEKSFMHKKSWGKTYAKIYGAYYDD